MSLTREQALDCFASDDLIGIGMEADAVRRRLHPEGVVSYVLESTIRYPDLEAGRDVASWATVSKPIADPALPHFAAIHAEIRDRVEMGCTSLSIQKHIDATSTLTWFEALFVAIKQHFPQARLSALSASEVRALSTDAGIPLRDTLMRLRDAGLDLIHGDGLPMPIDAMHSSSTSLQRETEDWLNVHRTAHELGLRTSAAVVFGFGETWEQRFAQLESVRQLQDHTGGFSALIPSSSQPNNLALRGDGWEEATAVEYLKTLAISRMVLDNISNVESSWATQGLKVSQMALRFGANDLGSLTLRNKSSGLNPYPSEEELRRLIRDAGFKPVQRDALYSTMFVD